MAHIRKVHYRPLEADIIGGLLSSLLGRSPSGHAYSGFQTQESVIRAMIAHHSERLGVSKSTLEAKFAAAKRALAGTIVS